MAQDHEIKLPRNKLHFHGELKTFSLFNLKNIVSCNCLLCQASNPVRINSLFIYFWHLHRYVFIYLSLYLFI